MHRAILRTTVLAVALIAGVLAFGTARAGTIWGYAYLEGETNHSGIKVKVIRYPFGLYCHDTVFTNSSGYWSLTIVGGWNYHVRYLKPCFHIDMEDTVWIPIIGSVQCSTVTLKNQHCQDLGWCDDYPYYPPGTTIQFPEDDGRHPPLLDYPIEWWYANFHLTGQTTGKDYGAFVAFFKDGPMRLFAVSDLSAQKYYSDADLLGVLTASTDSLDIEYVDQFLDHDYWLNDRQCDGSSDPFLYRLNVDAVADQDGQTIALDLYMQLDKAPMMVGGDGLVWIGDGSSYYYSYPRMRVIGVIEVHGVKEYVSGTAWFDHQWGKFILGDLVNWEWFSIQLDDNREIMVGDVWVNGQYDGSYSDGLNFFKADCSLELLDNYTITPLSSWTDPESGVPFATQWRIEEESKGIDLVVTAEFENQVMRSVLSDLFPGAIFWEGACTVSGTIDGQPVSGRAYAELTHPRAVLEIGGTLCSWIRPDIGDTRLRLMFDMYLPADDVQSTAIVLTECYGGDVMENFDSRPNTAVLSATSPGQSAHWGGYDHDAAKCLYPSAGRTSDDVHACADSTSHPDEDPQKLGEVVSLAPASQNGTIKGRHILFYAGIPDGLPNTQFWDTTYLRIIKQNFLGEYNTTVYSAGGRGPIDNFDYWGTGFGLRKALKDIRNVINPDEQFILFVSDHGGQRLVPNVELCGKGNCLSPESYTFPPSTLQDMADDSDNVPNIVIISDSCYTSPCTVKYCGKSYYPVYFNCNDTVEAEVDGVPTVAWAAVVDLNENDVCPDGDIIRVGSSDAIDLLEISLESGAISKLSCCNHDGIRGDVNYNRSGPNVADLNYLVDFLFRGGPPPPCWEEGNVDGTQGVNIADLTYLVDFLFRGGPPPPPCP